MGRISKTSLAIAVVTAGFLAGLAGSQDGDNSLEERLKQVRREVKVINLPTSIPRIPALVKREKEYVQVLDELRAAAVSPREDKLETLKRLYGKARDLKLAALKDLNEILRLHRGEHVGIDEKAIWERLKTRFAGVHYEDEWLVNILDDIEETAKINVELDARVYKFDSVSFRFDSTSARAMIQIMSDELEFKWVVRGDTLYVFKERNEVLFGRKYARQREKAHKERAKQKKAGAGK